MQYDRTQTTHEIVATLLQIYMDSDEDIIPQDVFREKYEQLFGEIDREPNYKNGDAVDEILFHLARKSIITLDGGLIRLGGRLIGEFEAIFHCEIWHGGEPCPVSENEDEEKIVVRKPNKGMH